MQPNELIQKTNAYINNNQADEVVKVALLAQQILDDIVATIQPGISESEATEAAHTIFKNHGIEKLWHRPLIRFNQNTLCIFKDRPTTNYVLQENDIAFIDIGIVRDGIEGDVGKTIVFGTNHEYLRLKNVCELLFHDAIEYWRTNNPIGIALYEFIQAEAKKHNVLFNLSPAGHLIGAFPHTHAWTKGASTFPEQLVAKSWILEIQIKSLTEPAGAFHEGLLY